ncbi:MAG: hypothetical protein AB9836_05980 [Aminipila sp.]
MAKEKTELTLDEREAAVAAKEAELAAKEQEITEKEEAQAEKEEAHEQVIAKGEVAFKQQLAEEEHVDIFIPPTQLYPEGSNMPVCLNGVTYTIPVGISFDKGVPKSIYNVWKTSYDADREARNKMKKALTGEISIG